MLAEGDSPPRNLWIAMQRGWRGRCPNCGVGELFVHCLKVTDRCADCGEQLAVQGAAGGQ